MKKLLLVFTSIVFVVAMYFVKQGNRRTLENQVPIQKVDIVEKEPALHYHAGFVVFKGGVRINFSGPEYMHVSPCSIENNGTDHMVLSEEQIEKAHLHSGIGDVVHVHHEGAYWRDLFININYPIDAREIRKAYINGRPVEYILDEPINAYDSVLIFISDESQFIPTNEMLNQAVTREYIEEVENQGEDC